MTKAVVFDSRPILIADPVGMVSYDYFTGYLTMRTGSALYYGLVDRDLLTLTGIARSHLAISHPFGYRYEFRRIPGP